MDDWRWYVDPRHNGVIQQLNQRVRDRILVLRKRVVVERQNLLVRYLAEDEAGRQQPSSGQYGSSGPLELWHLDMGLGFIRGNFQVIDEDEDQQF